MKCRKANRGFALVLIAVLTIATMCMGGCNSGTNDDEVTVSSETEIIEESEVIEEFETIENMEVTEDVIEEPTEPQTLNEWMGATEGTGIPISIWNDISKEGTIIEDEGEYYIVEGDQLLIEHNMCNISIPSSIVIQSSDEVYAVCDIVQLPEYVTVTIDSEVPQEYNFYVTTEEIDPVLPSELENPDEETTLEGENWLSSLDYDEPKLVFFNDETGVNTVVEDGETYQMQPGEQMVVYIPEGYMLGTTNCNYDGYECVFEENYVLILYEYKGATTNQIPMFDSNDNPISYTYEIFPVQ